jgi:hypothetical protein
MVTERQKTFRQEYRSRIMGWYDGYLHIAIIYAMGAAAFAIYLQHVHDHAPPGEHQGPARHLRAAHAQPSPVLH